MPEAPAPVPARSAGRIAARLAAVPLAAAMAAPAAAADGDWPKRRPGLWEVRTAGLQAQGMPPARQCVGEQTDTAAQHLDRQAGDRGACSLGAFRRVGEAWVADSVCRDARTVVTSRAIASGDLDTEYRIDTLVTYDPPLAGVRREDRDAVVARWLGPCQPGQKPGDLVVPGLGTLNLVDGQFRAEPDPRARAARTPARPAGPTDPGSGAAAPAPRIPTAPVPTPIR